MNLTNISQIVEITDYWFIGLMETIAYQADSTATTLGALRAVFNTLATKTGDSQSTATSIGALRVDFNAMLATQLAAGHITAQADSTATSIGALRVDFNALLANMIAKGYMNPS